MTKQKRVTIKRTTDALKKQFDEIVSGVQAAAQKLIDENPKPRQKLVAAGLLIDEAVEDIDAKQETVKVMASHGYQPSRSQS